MFVSKYSKIYCILPSFCISHSISIQFTTAVVVVSLQSSYVHCLSPSELIAHCLRIFLVDTCQHCDSRFVVGQLHNNQGDRPLFWLNRAMALMAYA